MRVGILPTSGQYLHARTCLNAHRISLIPLLAYVSTCTKQEKWLVMYMFVGISICPFSIGFWNCSFCEICFVCFSFYWYTFWGTLKLSLISNSKLKCLNTTLSGDWQFQFHFFSIDLVVYILEMQDIYLFIRHYT